MAQKTNHSLCTTAATVLFQANAHEKSHTRENWTPLWGSVAHVRTFQHSSSTAQLQRFWLGTSPWTFRWPFLQSLPAFCRVGCPQLRPKLSLSTIPLPWTIGSMSGCTVNVTYNVQPNPCTANQYTATDEQAVPTLTAKEVEELLSNF